MSTSSSEGDSEMVGLSTTSSGLESTGSILFSVPSDSFDVQTEITPLTSPTLSEEKMRTPRDILDASRRLGQISASALQGDMTPTKPPKQFRVFHRGSPQSVANDEAGYDADGDGDGDEDGDGGNGRTGAGASATTRPIRRPVFLRIDTRQHKRVASMLATRRPSPGFGDVDAHTDIAHPLRAKLAPLSSIRLKPSGAANANANVESYELRQRRRPNAQPVGLGIGFPENHPLRSRAFTMPMPVTFSPMSDDPEPSTGLEETRMRNLERRSEWLHASASAGWEKPMQVAAVCAPSPVRLALRPTFMEVSPSPIEYLPVAAAADARTFRCDVDVHHDRSEVSVRDPSESMVMLPACSAATSMTFYPGSHSALSQNAP